MNHEFGQARTLGELAWPEDLHCSLTFDDPVLNRYWKHATRAAAFITAGTAALDALPLDLEGLPGSLPTDPHAHTVWDWESIAPPMLHAVLLEQTGVDVSIDRSFPDGDSQMPPELAAATATVTRRLRTAASRLRGLLAGDRRGLAEWVADDATLSARGLVAAARVLGEYDARGPGSMWRAYVDAGVCAAERTALLLAPDAAPVRGHLRTVSPAEVDVLGPLDIALHHGGKESYTYFRAYERVRDPARSWEHSLQEWLRGASFGWPAGNLLWRREVGHPRVFDVVKPALASAEAAWHGFLTGLAVDEANTCLVAVPVQPSYLDHRWRAAAVLLCSPFVAARAADDTVWIIAGCAPGDVNELSGLSPDQSVWLQMAGTVDQAGLAAAAPTIAGVVDATAGRRWERLQRVAVGLVPTAEPRRRRQ